MNREQHLQKTFPLEDGTTYIQSLDKFNEPKGAGVGGESLKENFIDSSPITLKRYKRKPKERINRSECENYDVHGIGKFKTLIYKIKRIIKKMFV
jgi:hypothetical protein